MNALRTSLCVGGELARWLACELNESGLRFAVLPAQCEARIRNTHFPHSSANALHTPPVCYKLLSDFAGHKN